jgi:hypothetical protein
VKRRWYWKAYFFLSVLLVAVGIGVPVSFLDETTVPEMVAVWAALPLYVVQLVGLYGFIYWRRVGYARLWQLVFAATVIETGWSFYSMADDMPAPGLDTRFVVIMSLVGAALLAPLLVALFFYAFRSRELWAGASLKA